jgi:uncharacterized protein (DUF983 family)
MEAIPAAYPVVPVVHELNIAPATPKERPVWQAIWRGLRGHCPACDRGRIFYRYLKVNDKCPSCGEELFHQRADDAPPYMTIFVVGHLILASMLIVEDEWPDVPIWIHIALWPALTIILSLALLPMMKGALIAYQWALRMHGFDDAAEAEKPTVP